MLGKAWVCNMSLEKIKELRALTGCGVSDCKVALERTGDVQSAITELRKMGANGIDRRDHRKCSEGIVYSYIHAEGRIGVLLQVDCESDFVARSDDFRTFVHELSLQVVGARPICVSRSDIPTEKLRLETQLLMDQATTLNKPDAIVEKMVNGRLEKWFADICLLDQPWVKDGSRKMQDLLNDIRQKTGENIIIKRFARFEAGSS